jgi:hypothetical protein
MKRTAILITFIAVLHSSLTADTFTHKPTSKTFQGYATQIKKHEKTLVRIGSSGRYYDLSEFEIQYNIHGRRNEVHLIPINTRFGLNSQAVEFRKQIELSLNRGPIAIIIPVSSPGGSPEICIDLIDSITAAQNTPVYVWINREKEKGALSEAAFVSLCSTKTYMQTGSVISGIVRPEPHNTDDGYSPQKYQAVKDILTGIFTARRLPLAFVESLFNSDALLIRINENGNILYKSLPLKDIDPYLPSAQIVKPAGEPLLMTSSEALEAGLIDGSFPERRLFFDAMGIPADANIKTFDILSEIEQAFNNAERFVNSRLKECQFLAEQIAGGRKQLDIISAEYRQAKLRRTHGSYIRPGGGNIYYRRSSRYPSGWEHYKYVRDQRETLIRSLMRDIDSLTAAMDDILSIWLKYPELNGDIGTARQRISQYRRLYDQLNYTE